jgi:hypothetical protein
MVNRFAHTDRYIGRDFSISYSGVCALHGEHGESVELLLDVAEVLAQLQHLQDTTDQGDTDTQNEWLFIWPNVYHAAFSTSM